jgi:hypothetical protein
VPLVDKNEAAFKVGSFIRRWIKRLFLAGLATFGGLVLLGMILDLVGYNPRPRHQPAERTVTPAPSNAPTIVSETPPVSAPSVTLSRPPGYNLLPDAEATRALAAKKRQDAAFNYAVLFAKQLRASMREPDSFKLDTVWVTDNGAVCYQYRARNGFGGMNVEQAVMSPKLQFRTSDQPGFAQLWNRHCANREGEDRTSDVSHFID